MEYPPLPPRMVSLHMPMLHMCVQRVFVCVWTGVLCVLSTCVYVPLCARDLVQTLGFLPAAAEPGAPATFTSVSAIDFL